MGCVSSASKPNRETFLVRHAVDSSNLLPPCEDGIMCIGFPAGVTLMQSVQYGTDCPPQACELTAHVLEVQSTSSPDTRPNGESVPSIAPVGAQVPCKDRWPVRLSGTKSATEMRLEVHDAAGRGLGLLLWQSASQSERASLVMVCSTQPRHAGQPALHELKPHQQSIHAAKSAVMSYSCWDWVPTQTPLTLSSGEALYAWALVIDTESMRGGYSIYMPSPKGLFKPGKGSEVFTGETSDWVQMNAHEFHLTKGGKGCLLMEATSLAGDILGRPDKPQLEAWKLLVAQGIDPLLMLAFAVLYEKDRNKEHYVKECYGGN